MTETTRTRFTDPAALAQLLRDHQAPGFRPKGGWGTLCGHDGDASGGTLVHANGLRVSWEERRTKQGAFKEALAWSWTGMPISALEWRLLAPHT